MTSTKVDEFCKHLADICQSGCVMMAMRLAYEIGLFKLVCDSKEPVSALEIAAKLNLKERYTREILSCLVSANIIEQDRESSLYYIVDECKLALQQTIGFTPALGIFNERHETLKNCFKTNGPYGISYQDCNYCDTWFEWWHGFRNQGMCDVVVNKEILPMLEKPGLIPRLESGIHVLDLGCGPGNYTCELAQRFSNSIFIGLDYSKKAVTMAMELSAKKGIKNVTFQQGDAHNLPAEWSNTYDMVLVYDVLHDLSNPFKALQEIYRVIKDDGCLSLYEIGVHSNPQDNANNMWAAMYYALSLYICLPSSMADPPHIGFGICWGVEEIEKALLSEKFKIKVNSAAEVIGPMAFYHCTK